VAEFAVVVVFDDQRAGRAGPVDLRQAPGRQAQVRPGNDKEYGATTVMRIPLAEAACKTRSGPPDDDEEDLGIAAWAGVLPLAQARGTPVPDAQCAAAAPDYVRDWPTVTSS
jgi:hypothetical protein